MIASHYPDLGSTSVWLKQIFHVALPIRSTTQIWVITRQQCGIAALVSQMSFLGKKGGGVTKKFCSVLRLDHALQ